MDAGRLCGLLQSSRLAGNRDAGRLYVTYFGAFTLLEIVTLDISPDYFRAFALLEIMDDSVALSATSEFPLCWKLYAGRLYVDYFRAFAVLEIVDDSVALWATSERELSLPATLERELSLWGISVTFPLFFSSSVT